MPAENDPADPNALTQSLQLTCSLTPRSTVPSTRWVIINNLLTIISGNLEIAERREAPDGAVALALFDSDPFRIDLLLTDIVMPGMNGRQLADELLHRHPSLKVLFMTGYSRTIMTVQVSNSRLGPSLHPFSNPPAARRRAAGANCQFDAVLLSML